MRQIFIFTAGDKNARAHLQKSILKAVPFDWMQDALGHDQTDYYRSLLPGEEGFYSWGAVPGPVNRRTWNAMRVGDLVLTVYGNQYHFLSSVVGKFDSPTLASRIWDMDEAGKTWQYMYLLSKPQRIAVSVTSEPAINYLNKGYRGFTRISDEKIEVIRDAYGSLDKFVQQVFNAGVPETHVERELAQAEKEADSAAAFDPKDMADGRKKVIREVVRRQGQPKFRKELLKAYDGKCAVTGCDVEAVLEAAHIAPYLGTNSNAIQNGLLLRADVHTLFDLGQLKITPKGKIEIHENLLGTLYEQYQGLFLHLPDDKASWPSTDALSLKYDLVL